ncbi:MAG: FRG domain-containing protein [Paludibacter sp.]|nr:FRG domain-containing protein [Paludibacter sp.]
MNDESIKSVESLIGKINEILIHSWKAGNSTYTPWFRGQSSHNWQLKPQLYRNHNLNFYERELLRDFKNQTTQYHKNSYPRNNFEWLFLMQHYGLPTRILDWTESYLVALFFCINDYQNQEDGIIWMLDPITLNQATIGEQFVPSFSHTILRSYFIDEPILLDDNFSITNYEISRQVEAEWPICVMPTRNSPRSIAQKATFTIHGRNSSSLENIIEEKRNNGSNKVKLGKIIIDGNSKLSMLKELTKMGITYSVIFPEITGVAEELRMKYSEDFIGKIRKKEQIELKK